VDDPAAVEGTRDEQARAFLRALTELDARIQLLSDLPFESLSRMSLQGKIREIGETK
jgi:arsenate reductase